jgi:hypothetical protein
MRPRPLGRPPPLSAAVDVGARASEHVRAGALARAP